MSILITGGAGFIGSHTAKLFSESGLEVVVLDNLVTGRRERARWGSFVLGSIADATLVRKVIRDYAVSSVVHLAASAHVGESIRSPAAYFANNAVGSLSLLDAMMAEGVPDFVFASTCSVYGDSAASGTDDSQALCPVSPYGESKLSTERVLPWYQRAYGLRWAALRYFNVAGAESGLGEDTSTSARLIPRAVHAAIGQGAPLDVFGTTFATPDGSAVRDYVHVSDVAAANLQALHYLQRGASGAVVDVGAGTGVSVLQIIDEVETQTQHAVPFRTRPARPGDAASAVSNPAKAGELLHWVPVCSSLTNIVGSVLRSNCRATDFQPAAKTLLTEAARSHSSEAYAAAALPAGVR